MLLGVNSNTKCSIAFINIAVAISAVAGGAKNDFAPRPQFLHRVQRLVVFSMFCDDLWVFELKRAWRWNFGSF